MAGPGRPKADKRIVLRLRNEDAKAFTSRGTFLHGSVLELPAEEANRLIDLELAMLTEQDVNEMEPPTHVAPTL